MRTNLSKKLLAAVLSLAMVLSLVGIQPSNANAASYKITKKAEMKAGKTVTYKVTGVKKTQYIKVTKKNANVTVKYNNKKVSTSKKIAGTGKALSLKVTAKEVNKDYTNKMTVKIYNKKNNKVVKTLTVSTKVLTQVKEEEPTPEEPTPEEPVVEEATLVSLEATHVKELTATLSKEVAGLTEKDFTVKKGTVKVTPASVTVEGTKVVIALGTKITEGTYSVTYKESTVEVKTEDEKIVELKTVGTNFAQLKDNKTVLAGLVPGDIDTNGYNKTPSKDVDTDKTTVNARIEFQALNQYGDATTAEVTNVICSLGGTVKHKDPTARKNGVVEVYNIASTLGIVGNAAKIIIISKDGVSTSNDVVFAEEAKVKEMTLAGILDINTKELVETINAGSDLTNYELLFDVVDQYGNALDKSFVNGQSYSVAQILTNATLAQCDYAATHPGPVSKVLTTAADREVNEHAYVALPLSSSADDGAGVQVNAASAGKLQVIVVGDRFGTVFNGTIEVTEYDLIKTFSVTAPDRLYDLQENEVEFSAVTESGKEVKDYKTLSKFIQLPSTEAPGFDWVKNTDGSASLTYTPNDVCTTASTSKSKTGSTVTSAVFNVNKTSGVSAAKVNVVTKTFTVYEAPRAKSVIKYTGSTANADNTVKMYGCLFALEDQYGNTMTGDEKFYDDAHINLKYTTEKNGVNVNSNQSLNIENLAYAAINTVDVDKMYVSVDLQTSGLEDTWSFDKSKADCVVSFVKTNSTKVSSLKATWNNFYSTQKVDVNDLTSGISLDDIKVTGVSAGKTIKIPATQLSIKSDTYTAIKDDERLTAVKDATVTITVQLLNADDEWYTEEVTCDYKYSAAPGVFENIFNYSTVNNGAKPTLYKSTVSYDYLAGLFYVYNQYGENVTDEYTKSLEINLGRHLQNLSVTKNNSTSAAIDTTNLSLAPGNEDGEFTVTCTLKNGKTATQFVYLSRKADTTEVEVSNLTELIAAASNPTIETIVFVTNADIDITIPTADYGTKNLVILAPNASITNNATWKSVKIVEIKNATYHEYAANKVLVASDVPVSVEVKIAGVEITVATDELVTVKGDSAVEVIVADKDADVKLAAGITPTLSVKAGINASTANIVSKATTVNLKGEDVEALSDALVAADAVTVNIKDAQNNTLATQSLASGTKVTLSDLDKIAAAAKFSAKYETTVIYGANSKNVTVIFKDKKDNHYLSNKEITALNIKPSDITVKIGETEFKVKSAGENQTWTVYDGDKNTNDAPEQKAVAVPANGLGIYEGDQFDDGKVFTELYGADAGYLKINLSTTENVTGEKAYNQPDAPVATVAFTTILNSDWGHTKSKYNC